MGRSNRKEARVEYTRFGMVITWFPVVFLYIMNRSKATRLCVDFMSPRFVILCEIVMILCVKIRLGDQRKTRSMVTKTYQRESNNGVIDITLMRDKRTRIESMYSSRNTNQILLRIASTTHDIETLLALLDFGWKRTRTT